MPHLAASGCVQDTMPLVLWTTLLLLGHFMNLADGGGKTDGVVCGIVQKGRAGGGTNRESYDREAGELSFYIQGRPQ